MPLIIGETFFPYWVGRWTGRQHRILTPRFRSSSAETHNWVLEHTRAATASVLVLLLDVPLIVLQVTKQTQEMHGIIPKMAVLLVPYSLDSHLNDICSSWDQDPCGRNSGRSFGLQRKENLAWKLPRNRLPSMEPNHLLRPSKSSSRVLKK